MHILNWNGIYNSNLKSYLDLALCYIIRKQKNKKAKTK